MIKRLFLHMLLIGVISGICIIQNAEFLSSVIKKWVPHLLSRIREEKF